jgi:hypothetical protein
MKQFFGWTPRSNMLIKYVHFRGNEAKNDLLRAKGLLSEEKQVDILQPKTCPHCREPDRPDAQFCFSCNFVMSFDAYHRTVEEGQKKDRELQELKDQMKSMQEDIKNMFEVVRMAKQNNGMIGGGRTILDENRHITFYDGSEGKIRSVSIPIDSVKIDQ